MPGIFTNATRCPKMISPNSFCGFVFTRAVDMNLDPPFLYNPLNKNVETNWNYYSERVEFYTRFWNDISELILWICFHKGHRYELRHAIPVQPSAQKWRNQFDLLLGLLGKSMWWYVYFWNMRMESTVHNYAKNKWLVFTSGHNCGPKAQGS